jgi:hypothetical protein
MPETWMSPGGAMSFFGGEFLSSNFRFGSTARTLSELRAAGNVYSRRTSLDCISKMTDATQNAVAWRDAAGRIVAFRSIQLAICPIILAFAFLSKKSASAANNAAKFAIPAWLALYVGAGVWLNRFRCPRCGKLFYWRLERQGYMDRARRWRSCRHCGLQQGSGPDTT